MKILLEGRPGSGKTTVARRLIDRLRATGLDLAGFTTEELRERGRRVGFAVESTDGQRAIMAHTEFRGPPKVGKYGVDLAAFERVALPALTTATGVVVVDEVGKMELASPSFCEAVARLMDSDAYLVATVHVFKHPFTDALKARPDVERMSVTERNRHDLADELAIRLAQASAERR